MKIKSLLDYFNFDDEKPVSKENSKKQQETDDNIDEELIKMIDNKEEENKRLVEKHRDELGKDLEEVDKDG